MENKLLEFWDYKLFIEQLNNEKHRNSFINMLCEVAELEFLSKLPREIGEDKLISYINKMNAKYNAQYDSHYLKERWVKIFKSQLYNSVTEAVLIILKRDKNKCQYCNRINKLQIHHVIPKDEKRYRGVNSYYNLVVACEQCNHEISNAIYIPQNWWHLHPESKHCPNY